MTDRSTPGKVAWLCTYVPEEIIRAAGWEPFRPLPQAESRARADRVLSPNLCPYVRGVAAAIEAGAYPDLRGVIAAVSCNAMLHLYSVLHERRDLFCYLLDLPRKPGPEAEEFFAAELARFADFLAAQGRPVSRESLQRAVAFQREREHLLNELHDRLPGRDFAALLWAALENPASQPPAALRELAASRRSGAPGSQKKRPGLLLTGAIPPQSLLKLLTEVAPCVIHDHCLGLRYFAKAGPPEPDADATREELLRYLARRYLGKPPCPRLFPETGRAAAHREILEKRPVLGVVFHELTFCDLSAYDGLLWEELCAAQGLPRLRVKTELGREDVGQLRTRVQAFLEMLGPLDE